MRPVLAIAAFLILTACGTRDAADKPQPIDRQAIGAYVFTCLRSHGSKCLRYQSVCTLFDAQSNVNT